MIGALEDAEDYKAFEAAIITDYDAQSAVEHELVLMSNQQLQMIWIFSSHFASHINRPTPAWSHSHQFSHIPNAFETLERREPQ